jgi:hypothetical protein
MNEWLKEHPDKMQEMKEQWSAEVEKQKSDIRKRTITPDSVGGGSQPPVGKEGAIYNSPREAADAYKRKMGIQD